MKKEVGEMKPATKGEIVAREIAMPFYDLLVVWGCLKSD
jgi:hypothetical protein